MPIKLNKIPDNVKVRLRDVVEEIARVPGEAALWLFGSYARGNPTPLSDVDIAYLSQDALSPPMLDRLDHALYRMLSQGLGTDELTLVDLRRAPSGLCFRVLSEGRLLHCGRPEQVASFKEEVIRLYPEAQRLKREVLSDFSKKLGGAAMQIDKAKILDQLRLLDADVQKLREKAKLSLGAYLADTDTQSVVERRFQTATEACVNIGNHLISRLGLRMAEDYASVFESLFEGGIVSEELSDTMKDMARFRNLLVHLYWKLDHKKVHAAMGERIHALEAFMSVIHQKCLGE